MNILIISEYFPQGKSLQFSGGVETRNYYIAKSLGKKHNVTIITNRIKGTKKLEIISGFNVLRVGRGVKYQAAAGGILNRIFFLVSCVKSAKTINADLVEGTNFATHLAAYLIGKMKNVPVVIWYPDVWIGSWVKNAGFVGVIGEIIERINLSLSFDKYIAISQETRKKLGKHVTKNIAVIPCGVDLQEFKSELKKENGTILCVSRLAKYKNIGSLILAFALIKKDQKNLKLRIVGTGPEESSLKKLVRNLKLEKDITFESNLSRSMLLNYFKTAQLFCLPSSVEGFGISVVEAAAAQTPYIVSDIPVFDEITENYKGGLSFRTGNIRDLASKISLLISDKKLYLAKQKECRHLAQKYDWKNIAIKTEKEYLKVTR